MRRSKETLIGCDFGAPRKAGDQAKKIIAIEAQVIDVSHYAIRTTGPNERLNQWRNGQTNSRPGWSLPELRDGLASDRSLTVAAFDFPFSLPASLLQDPAFASRMQETQPFHTRERWAEFVASRLRLQFTREGPLGEMTDLDSFAPWRDTSLWIPRACDIATRAAPPLKHIGQNVFAMTLAGTALLYALQNSGYIILSGQTPSPTSRILCETYPSLVARRIGFQGSYKQDPVRCIREALLYLANRGIRLDFDPGIHLFCESYRTGGKQPDPDGADAFLCLVAAICYRAGLAEVIYGDASPAQRAEEGGIVAPLYLEATGL